MAPPSATTSTLRTWEGHTSCAGRGGRGVTEGRAPRLQPGQRLGVLRAGGYRGCPGGDGTPHRGRRGSATGRGSAGTGRVERVDPGRARLEAQEAGALRYDL